MDGKNAAKILHSRVDLSVAAETRVCQKWLTTDYSSSGKLLSPAAVEEGLGERLRLSQYRQRFLNEDAVKELVQVLAESQPPVQVGLHTLRQWYVKYHPDSGPLRYATAEALNDVLGDHMRAVCVGMRGTALKRVLYIQTYLHTLLSTCRHNYLSTYIHT